MNSDFMIACDTSPVFLIFQVGLRVYEGSPSPAQEAVIDTEVNRLLNDSYSRALAVLKVP